MGNRKGRAGMPQKQSGADKLAELTRMGAEAVAVRYEENLLCLTDQCESPIEQILLAAMFVDHDCMEFDVVFLGKDEPNIRFHRDETIYVYQQAKVGEYRADFLIHDCSVPAEIQQSRWMIVECDGHDFHERTKEQARRDKKRDRFFQSLGFKVLRFTGSEIWADAIKCAEEVYSQLATNDRRGPYG
jgi:very-short-patch-repair endonuclease